jgi:hypothetical protein
MMTHSIISNFAINYPTYVTADRLVLWRMVILEGNYFSGNNASYEAGDTVLSTGQNNIFD